MSASKSPIIIIGMHRSGTTMITDLLEKLGLYMGWVLQENSEALFFVERNEKLMNVCGGSWGMPFGVEQLLRHRSLREQLAARLLRDMESLPFLSYLGPRRYLKYRNVHNLDFAWGWKDPRNTFLLPVWLDLFPKARVVHIYRNGVDVACSLEKRETRVIEDQVQRLSHRGSLTKSVTRRLGQFQKESPLLYIYRRFRSLRSRFVPLRSYDRFAVAGTFELSKGFDLWCAYIRKCCEITDAMPTQSLTLKYEDFLADPEKNLAALVKFCGLSASAEQIKSLCTSIRPDRRFAFKTNVQAVSLYDQVRRNEWMARLGYADL